MIDALIVHCIYQAEHAANPTKALADLISWETRIALDPLVSSEAQALWDSGHRAGREKSPTYAENQQLRDRIQELEDAIHLAIGCCGNDPHGVRGILRLAIGDFPT